MQWVEDHGSRRLVMPYTHVPPPGDGPWRIGAHRLCWDGQRFELEEATGQLLGPPGVANKELSSSPSPITASLSSTASTPTCSSPCSTTSSICGMRAPTTGTPTWPTSTCTR